MARAHVGGDLNVNAKRGDIGAERKSPRQARRCETIKYCRRPAGAGRAGGVIETRNAADYEKICEREPVCTVRACRPRLERSHTSARPRARFVYYLLPSPSPRSFSPPLADSHRPRSGRSLKAPSDWKRNICRWEICMRLFAPS